MGTRFYLIELYENLLFLVHLLLDCQVEENIRDDNLSKISKLPTQYGIKVKVDDNSKQISINKEKIKEKINSIIYNDPLDIIKSRLAKGEITLEEYNNLKKALNKKSIRNSQGV